MSLQLVSFDQVHMSSDTPEAVKFLNQLIHNLICSWDKTYLNNIQSQGSIWFNSPSMTISERLQSKSTKKLSKLNMQSQNSKASISLSFKKPYLSFEKPLNVHTQTQEEREHMCQTSHQTYHAKRRYSCGIVCHRCWRCNCCRWKLSIERRRHIITRNINPLRIFRNGIWSNRQLKLFSTLKIENKWINMQLKHMNEQGIFLGNTVILCPPYEDQTSKNGCELHQLK